MVATVPFCVRNAAKLLGFTTSGLARRLASSATWPLVGFALPMALLPVVLPLPAPGNAFLGGVIALLLYAATLAFRYRTSLASMFP
jgi:hypothetical protein